MLSNNKYILNNCHIRQAKAKEIEKEWEVYITSYTHLYLGAAIMLCVMLGTPYSCLNNEYLSQIDSF